MSQIAKVRIRECLETQNNYLDLSGCKLSDLDKEVPELFECGHLMGLWLVYNQLTDASGLSALTNLTELNLNNNQITDASGLSAFINLTELNLNNNQITDVSALSSLTKLKKLDLSFNQLSDVSALSGLTNLTEINLINNQLTDVSALSGLTKLKKLDLSFNQLSDVSALSSLTKLKKLDLSFNQLSDVSALSGLSDLTSSEFDGNQISDFKFLLHNEVYKSGELKLVIGDNPNPQLNEIVKQGYEALKQYYDTLEVEGRIQNDQLKVIVLGNSTAGKTTLTRYWGNKEFSERQLTTHGLARSLELPLRLNDTDKTFRVNVWDFGGQDYYHATYRLFVTADSTYVLVCNKALEDKPREEMTNEYLLVDGEETAVEISVQHYPYRFWLQTLAFLTKAGRIDDSENRKRDRSRLPKLFLVENKCSDTKEEKRMHLPEALGATLPFEIIGHDFYHLDIREAWRFQNDPGKYEDSAEYAFAFKKFERKLNETLQAQIRDHRYVVHQNYPVIRDLLAQLAEYQQSADVPEALNQYLIEEKIAPIEQYEKLPVWMTYDQYQDLVKKNSRSAEPDFNSLHIYLQNLCGRIFHFRDIEELKDIVFIDPNWLHQTIYKVLSQQVFDHKGEFTLEQADDVINGDILEASQFMEVMKQFELVFEIPRQTPRRFVAPQYLPIESPLSPIQLEKYREQFHQLSLTIEFPYYLPPSLISRVISHKGDLIKNQDEPYWRNGLVYSENGLSIFLLCTPEDQKIEIYLSPAEKSTHQKALRKFMDFMEQKFPNEIEEILLSLPGVTGRAKWKHLYRAKKENMRGAKNYDYSSDQMLVDSHPFAFLFEEFERKPINVFVCYAHDDGDEMRRFTEALQKELRSFQAQHKIKINSFTDLELRPGMLWDTVLKEQIKRNDILICLLSPSFFGSGYIEQNEYGQVMREIAAGQRDSLVAPVYLKACYVAGANPIANLQFFNPPAKAFGLRSHMANFSFSNLLDRRKKSLVDNYVASFVESIKPGILEIWERK